MFATDEMLKRWEREARERREYNKAHGLPDLPEKALGCLVDAVLFVGLLFILGFLFSHLG